MYVNAHSMGCDAMLMSVAVGKDGKCHQHRDVPEDLGNCALGKTFVLGG
jgi:hypothetical protein